MALVLDQDKFPLIDCKSCGSRCGFSCHAKFNMVWLLAWSKAEPLPACADYHEKYWRGKVAA